MSGGLTPAKVNASNFGFQIRATAVASTIGGFLYYPATIVIYYTLPGTDSGDYVLPGSAETYPYGGLHARYYNDADIAGNAAYLRLIMNPTRSQAYSGSGTAEYFNRQDTRSIMRTRRPRHGPRSLASM